jgi:Na+/proline symporter
MDEDRTPRPGELNEEPAGETEVRLSAYLTEHGFVDAVMERIYELQLRPRKSLAWGLFCLANLILLAVLGANELFLEEFFTPQAELAQFFFLFLGITFLGGLVGLVLSVDTSRLLSPHHRGR